MTCNGTYTCGKCAAFINGKEMSRYFVWLPSQTGPQAQIWHDLPVSGEGKLKIEPIFKIKLDENDKSTLSQLTVIYPAPK